MPLNSTIENSHDLHKQIKAIVQGAGAILQNMDFVESARRIFDQCKEMTGATAGYVALLDEKGAENEVLFLDAGNLPCTVDPNLPMPIRGLRSKSYETGKAVFHNDFMNSEWVDFMPEGHVFLRNVMFAPLILDDRAVGLIGLANKEGDFTEDDARVSTIFGELASIALKNSLVEEEKNIALQELKQSHEDLKNKHEELRKAQSTIVHQEKMATIGQLAAGVAHEINNPLGFITSNMRSLEKYVAKFVEFIDAQTEALKSMDAEKLVEESRKKLKIDYLREDIKELLNESMEGAVRVSEIVQNLKSFSRVGELKLKKADINECLDSTIKVIWNELKYKTKVNKDYGELPLLNCNSQELNQVFMNIILNGAHSIADQGEISIKTWQEENNLLVAISDTGSGIHPDHFERLFEPFFTTKESGKGTGLGLSISHEIVKKHNGNITVDSQLGKGTTFTIALPLSGKIPAEKG